MKKLFGKFWEWGKRHIFHFVTIIIFIIIGVFIVSQQAMIYSLRSQVKKVPEKISKAEKDIKEWFDKQNLKTRKKINNNYEATNARIDIVDSAIKPDKKRRKLIVNIRSAIKDNTNRTIGVRDLNKMANSIIDYSYEFNFTIPQILAQMDAESDFDCKVTSAAGAQGCMQIMPKTLKYIQHEMHNAPSRLNPWNIHHNVRAGCFYMAEQIERFGKYEEALRAYNWGPTSLAKYNAGLIPDKEYPQETRDYVPKILNLIEKYKTYGLEQVNE